MSDLSTSSPNLDARSSVPVSGVVVSAGRRKLDPSWVTTLADMFAAQGQQAPIEVIAEVYGFRLVFGHHRLAAAIHLGWTSIWAVVKQRSDYADEAEITLREITENLARRELSVLDRAVDIARWRETYLAANVVSKGGRPSKNSDPEELSAKFALSFSDQAQQTFGLSRRSVFHATKIAAIVTEIRERIALHAIADNQTELLSFAAEPFDRQAKIVALLTSEPAQSASVAEAIAIIDRAPKPSAEPRWQKVSTAFSNLKEGEQDRFFSLHEAAIQRWLKGRSS